MGNNREVVDSNGKVIQINNYYPFGTPFYDEANTTNASLQPFKYNGKELDMMHGLNTYDYGARQYYSALPVWDRVDPLAEKYYSISPYVYCANNPVNLIDLIGEEPTDAEAARIAAHVYGDKKDDILIGGWRVSKRDFRISLSDQYGLKSQVYEKVEHGKVTEYVYATAGTEDGNDWKQNVLQPIGLSAQYKHAAENAKIISNVLKSTEVNFVGHSLGGGEAALNSLVTSDCGYEGRKAFTFNAAGVGSITKMLEGGLRASLKSEGKINAYILTTDPLNNIQNIHPAMPNVNGVRHYLMPKDFSSVINGHSINSILKNFGVDPKRYSK